MINPPIIPIKRIAGWIFDFRDTIIGLMKLSAIDEIEPKIITPTAAKMFPVKRRYNATGIQIITVPMIGKIPANDAINVNKSAFGTQKLKKPKPAIIPWMNPTMTCP